ncbi:MAG: DUF1592 domain-containing protein [Acidobacteriota bacterium]
MRRWVWFGAAVLAVLALSVPQAAGPQAANQGSASPSSASTTAPGTGQVVKQYCEGCHNARLKTAGLVLEGQDFSAVPANADLWEKVIRKLRTGAMPPPGARRPDAAAIQGLAAWLESELDRAVAAHPNPGEPLVHRLNRAEYANAIRDLLAVDVDVARLLPPDDSAFGFDNVSDVLGLSPVLIERYVAAAESISALAVGEGGVSPGAETYFVRQDRSQDQHIEGLPLGTLGGLRVTHTFPLDGDYTFQVALLRTNNDGLVGLERAHQIEIAVDGARVLLETVGGDPGKAPVKREKVTEDDVDDEPQSAVESKLRVTVPIKAGQRTVTAAFVQKRGADTMRLQPFVRSSTSPYDSTGMPHIRTLTVAGPFNATGPGDTPMRRRVFTCRPSSTAASERSCATQILSTLARRAYRRPVTTKDLQPLLAFYDAGRMEGGFETGVQRAVQRILASPKFVLRVERDPAKAVPGSIHPLTDLELASRLSFFLWSSIPDDQLLDLASKGQLSTTATLDKQVRRMLDDPKADALVSNFAGQWLQLRNLRNTVPDPEEFPDFDDQLREGFARETELFFASIVREDHNVLDLLTANYTFVNERLAKHYGIPFVNGTHFRRVLVTDENRQGLLGHGSLLTVTSHANRTAPVLRGKWVLDALLGTPPPPPPPNVNTDLPTPGEGEKAQTMRQMMETHRANPVCASCHKLMDPIGLAMEHFDAVGAWRSTDAGGPIDASTQLLDGTKVDGVVALRAALLKRPGVIVETFTERLMTYALGRGLHAYDMPAVREIVRTAAQREYRFSAIVLGIVNSTPFRMRLSDNTTPAAEKTRVAKR